MPEVIFGLNKQLQRPTSLAEIYRLQKRNLTLGLVKYNQNNLWTEVSHDLPPQSCC